MTRAISYSWVTVTVTVEMTMPKLGVGQASSVTGGSWRASPGSEVSKAILVQRGRK